MTVTISIWVCTFFRYQFLLELDRPPHLLCKIPLVPGTNSQRYESLLFDQYGSCAPLCGIPVLVLGCSILAW